MVYAPEWLLKNVVDECCSPTSISPFCLDTTYNIGPFYVTPTVYIRKDVVHEKYGNDAVFPGPAMFHVNRSGRDFFFFAATLAEINFNITKCKFIGGDRDGAQQYFLRLFPEATFLPCTKHVEDDISRKMKEMNIPKSVADKYIQDIFGSVKLKKKGLIDAKDASVFGRQLEKVSEQWDDDFKDYFVKNIKCDMEKGMLMNVRQYLGLDRFYNNGSENINKKYKAKIRSYISKEEGIVRSRSYNLPLEVAVEIYESMVVDHCNNLSAAITKNGAYALRGELRNAVIAPETWDGMTVLSKQKVLAKIDNYFSENFYSVRCDSEKEISSPAEELSSSEEENEL